MITVIDPDVGERFGLWRLRGLLGEAEVAEVVELTRGLARVAPLARPTMLDGVPLTVRVTSWGDLGWWADRGGYRYVDRHPVTARPWPAIPPELRRLAAACVEAANEAGAGLEGGLAEVFDSCLVNFYDDGASLGWHVDRTEQDRHTPILNVSIGATARFEIEEVEGPGLGDRTVHRVPLLSGDVVIMAGAARLARHRIAKIEPVPAQEGLFGSAPRSPLRSGRISLTFRRVRRA
jgi:alkylated DNA repair protein (DNA oxidative demethylase)